MVASQAVGCLINCGCAFNVTAVIKKQRPLLALHTDPGLATHSSIGYWLPLLIYLE